MVQVRTFHAELRAQKCTEETVWQLCSPIWLIIIINENVILSKTTWISNTLMSLQWFKNTVQWCVVFFFFFSFEKRYSRSLNHPDTFHVWHLRQWPRNTRGANNARIIVGFFIFLFFTRLYVRLLLFEYIIMYRPTLTPHPHTLTDDIDLREYNIQFGNIVLVLNFLFFL